VIDFIDMEERRNNNAVEKRFKERLKTDRARIQVGRISGFGLLEMSRQRLRPGMLEATTQPCPSCHGTGLVRSDDSLGLTILRQIEEEGVRKRSREVLLKAPVGIVNFLMNQKREHIAQIEARYGMSVRVEADPFLISPDFSLEKFKTATRVVDAVSAPVVSADASLMLNVEEEAEDETQEDEAQQDERQQETGEGDGSGKKRRRRRRRRRGSGGGNGNGEGQQRDEGEETAREAQPTPEPVAAEARPEVTAEAAEPAEEPKPKKRTTRSRKKTAEVPVEAAGADEDTLAPKEAATPAEAGEPLAAEEKPKRKRAPRKKKTDEAETPAPDAAEAPQPTPEPVQEATPEPEPAREPVPEAGSEPVPEPERAPEFAEADAEPEEDQKPKKRGWWSIGR